MELKLTRAEAAALIREHIHINRRERELYGEREPTDYDLFVELQTVALEIALAALEKEMVEEGEDT